MATIRLLLVTAGLLAAAAPGARGGEEPAAPAPARAFLEDCATKAANAKTMTVAGKDGWLFLKGELKHLGLGEFWGPAAEKTSSSAQADARDPLAAILHYKEQLDKAGIELVLVPVPPKAVVYPEMISDAAGAKPPRLDVHHQEFYRLLGEKGVKVIDLVPALAAERAKGQGPLYCQTDTHWSGLATVIAARAVAAELGARPWFKDPPKTKFEGEERAVAFRGDLVEALKAAGGAEPPEEKLALRFVGTKDGPALKPVKTDPKSPVLLVSDSHGLVFSIGEDLFARGAGLPDQLAFELGFAVDTVSSRGDGVTKVRIDLYQRAKADPAWLAGKKVMIWCFSARNFTECTNGWRKLPVKKGG
ncbi:MAG TPA: hypothetical protein PK280_03185 [Planctomycetota bacterium]|nr:hypothetical protein [Planctomycetota bacterium]